MKTRFSKLALSLLLILTLVGFCNLASADPVKGIYITQTTAEDTSYFKYLIARSKAVGINTFVVDMEIASKRYQKNVTLLKENNIRYVARVIVFPQGGHPDQIASPDYWAKRYALMEKAISYGAQEIQLDYIRYNSKQHASSENAKHIFAVVQWFKDKLQPQGIPLQADVFGISSFGESKHIGQNLRMMAQSVDALCPMVYPSHFEPYKVHAVTPYQTIYHSLQALQYQFDNKLPVKVYAYIEISNYRFPLPGDKRRNYVLAEMKAVQDSGINGYYVWSAHNKYDYLFDLLAEINKSPRILADAKVNNAGEAAIEKSDETTPEPKAEKVAAVDSVPAYIRAEAEAKKNSEESKAQVEASTNKNQPVKEESKPNVSAKNATPTTLAKASTPLSRFNASRLNDPLALNWWPISIR